MNGLDGSGGTSGGNGSGSAEPSGGTSGGNGSGSAEPSGGRSGGNGGRGADGSGGVAVEVIRTGRLDLVPLRVAHAEEMAAVLSDPALHRFIGGAPDSPEALRARYRRMVAGSPDPAVAWRNWVVLLRAESCLTGTVQATVGPAEHGRKGPVAEIAWVVGAPWQGRGIAKEAARALVDWLAGQPVRSVIAHIHPEHEASAAVATACGLSPTDEVQDGEIRWYRSLAG